MLKKRYHFITGLPRSGSTLLTSILLQNPRFHSSITDPMCPYVMGMLGLLKSEPGMRTEMPIERRISTIRGMFEGYYSGINKEVIFNTNRAWTYMTHVMKEVYPDAKYILCVRDVNSVLNSFETLHRKNALTPNTISGEYFETVYDRVGSHMSAKGIVGLAYIGIKQAITGQEKDRLIIVEYDQMCQNPDAVMRAIYSFIDEPYYNHDFNNVEKTWDEYDKEIGITVHHVRKSVENAKKEMILPPDIINQYKNAEIWR